MQNTTQSLPGSCHCRNVTYTLDWPEGLSLSLRKCNCTFCTKHAPAYFGNPKASLAVTVRDVSALTKYEFGTRTASFHFCKNCGVFLFATSVIDGHAYAVLNANTLDGVVPSSVAETNFEGENVDVRLSRRMATWIRDFRMTLASGGA